VSRRRVTVDQIVVFIECIHCRHPSGVWRYLSAAGHAARGQASAEGQRRAAGQRRGAARAVKPRVITNQNLPDRAAQLVPNKVPKTPLPSRSGYLWNPLKSLGFLERAKGFEPSTPTLAR
jgi:hypothetical protein